jgi:hypothetical protein
MTGYDSGLPGSYSSINAKAAEGVPRHGNRIAYLPARAAVAA